MLHHLLIIKVQLLSYLTFVEYVESTQNNMPVEEMNIVLSFLGSAEF